MKLGDLDGYQSKYLRPADLGGRAFDVTIERVTIETMRPSGAAGDPQKLAVLWFAGGQKGLVVNRTRLTALTTILGTDDSDQMIGRRIRIRPAKQNGRDTIEIIQLK